MNNVQIQTLAFILLLNIACLSVSASQGRMDYHTPENIRKFADFLLYTENDYLRAAGEYQRYLFYSSADTAQILYKIGIAYRLGGKTEQAIRTFEKLLQTHPKGTFTNSAYYQIGASYFLAERFEQSVKFLHQTLPNIRDAKHRAQSQQLIGLSYLMQKRWSEASEVFKGLQESDAIIQVREKASVYHNYAKAGANLPTRSPFIAGFLSTILPGAGRLYTGSSINDVLSSLLIVGVTGWQAYDGFHRDGLSSAKGWTLGILSGSFYIGNIYGSAIAARLYNRRIENEFLTTLTIELH